MKNKKTKKSYSKKTRKFNNKRNVKNFKKFNNKKSKKNRGGKGEDYEPTFLQTLSASVLAEGIGKYLWGREAAPAASSTADDALADDAPSPAPPAPLSEGAENINRLVKLNKKKNSLEDKIIDIDRDLKIFKFTPEQIVDKQNKIVKIQEQIDEITPEINNLKELVKKLGY